MDDLVAFVKARLDEDEAVAQAATGRLSGRWRVDIDGNVQDEDTGGGGNAYIACGPYGGVLDEADAAHIGRHDPARVLREVAAKRELTDWAMTYWEGGHDAEGGLRLLAQAARQVLERIAEVWADHPDYRDGWKP